MCLFVFTSGLDQAKAIGHLHGSFFTNINHTIHFRSLHNTGQINRIWASKMQVKCELLLKLFSFKTVLHCKGIFKNFEFIYKFVHKL